MANSYANRRVVLVPAAPPHPPFQLAAGPATLMLPPPSVVAQVGYLVPLGGPAVPAPGYITNAFFVQDPVLALQPPKVMPAPAPPPVVFQLTPAALMQMDELRTRSLLKFMADEGLEPSPEDEIMRKRIIDHLKRIAFAWIKKVARRQRLPINVVGVTSATVLTYGSYGLGVHGSESDIDALCIGPHFATLKEDFFVVLRKMLESRPEVSELHCVKNAKVPLMRFKFKGILVDFTYAQLPAISVYDVDFFNPSFNQTVDETSWRSLSGVRANKCILQLVPNIKNFQLLVRCIKLWAKRRGVNGHLFGFFGGVHLAILAAFICQRHPNASISALVRLFFATFSQWPWPQPVILQDQFVQYRNPEGRLLMPIMMPCSPYEWCYSNITRSTYNKIISEFQRGYDLFWVVRYQFQDPRCMEFRWNHVFEAFPYAATYPWFLRILLVAPDGDDLRPWVGWVKSRLRFLLLKVESLQLYCDPNPTEYVDHNVVEPNTVFYWGLSFNGSAFTDINSLQDDFLKCVYTDSCCEERNTKCKLELSIMEALQLPKSLNLDAGVTSRPCRRILHHGYYRRKPVYMQCLPIDPVATDRDYQS